MPRHVKRRTKPRGHKLSGGVGNRSMDMCPYCISFRCDPMAMSPAFQHKIRERTRKHLCPACGRPAGFCRCRSTILDEKAGRPIRHDNKKLRRAIAAVEAREQAYQTWTRNEDALCAAVGEQAYGDAAHALYHHTVPAIPWQTVEAAARTGGVDIEALRPGWEPRDEH